jgi:hypothetical protein
MLRGRFLSAISLLILLTAIYCSGQDAASDIRKALQNEYQGKVLIIRGFYSGAKLQYDSQANIVDGATRGSWSSDGLVQLNDISLDQQKLHISGHRVITLFDSKDDIFKDRLTHEQIDIDIEVDPTWKELPAFENVLGRVFTRDRNYFTTEAADYWGHWLSGPIVQVRDWEWKCTGEEKNPVRTTAYRVGGGISAPRAIIAADADYSAIARK